MAPGLGLYLNELFFDGYNLKLKRELERAQQSTKSKAVPNVRPVTTTTPGESADDDGDGNQVHEIIEWNDDPEIGPRLHEFRENVLHPHIFEVERSSLVYFYYMDYCRAFPHTFKPRESEETQ